MSDEVALERIERSAPSPEKPAGRAVRVPTDYRSLFVLRGKPSPKAEIVVALAGCVLLIALWEIAARLRLTNPIFLPAPSVVAVTFWQMMTQGDLLYHSGVSTLRVWAAFLLSAVMAIPLGIVMSSYRIVGAALEPIVDFIRYLPVPALVPLSIIWFGVGEETKIFLLWLGTFFQLVLLVADDMRRVPHEYVETALTLGASPPQVLADIGFRAMLPNLVDSLRITLGWCWTYLIIAEIVAAQSGIGFVIWTARRYMKTPEVMAGVIAIGIIGLVTDQLLRALHRRAFRYL